MYKNRFFLLILGVLSITIIGCSENDAPSKNASVKSVSATFATPIAVDGKDSVDDPAIYIHKGDALKSFVIATNKSKVKGGLYVYDLEGVELAFIADGRMNNVDIRYDFPFDGRKVDIAVATHRDQNSLAIYEIDADAKTLIMRGDSEIKLDFSPYGGCLYHSAKTGKFSFFATSKEGIVEQWALHDNGQAKIAAEKVRSLSVGSQVEGCVADDDAGVIFIGEEDEAIWKYNAEPDGGDQRFEVDRVGPHLTDDIEGVTLYSIDDKRGYIIASSQGNSTYAVYDRIAPHAYLGSFQIVAEGDMEGTEETDGVAVTNVPLGGYFPKGLFIAHDNRKSKGKGSNFKYVSWEEIEKQLNLPS